MQIDCIKGYDYITISEKKAEKLEIGSRLANGEALREQMLDALRSDGAVYALCRKRELYACYIFRKTEHVAEDFMTSEEAVRWGHKRIQTLELAQESSAPEVEPIAEKVREELLDVLKEKALFCGCHVILWDDMCCVFVFTKGNTLYLKLLASVGIGFTIGYVLDSVALGVFWMCICLFFSGWTVHQRTCQKEEQERGI